MRECIRSAGTPDARAYYEADGETFTCDVGDCTSAAQRVAEYCSPEGSTCSVGEVGRRDARRKDVRFLAIAAALGVAFAVARRRRSRGVGIAGLALMAFWGVGCGGELDDRTQSAQLVQTVESQPAASQVSISPAQTSAALASDALVRAARLRGFAPTVRVPEATDALGAVSGAPVVAAQLSGVSAR